MKLEQMVNRDLFVTGLLSSECFFTLYFFAPIIHFKVSVADS